jgi:hypothetical protein
LAKLIWTKNTLTTILLNFIRDSLPEGIGTFHLKLDFFHDSNNIFDFLASTDNVNIRTIDDTQRKEIIECLSRSGALNIETTFMPAVATAHFDRKSINTHDWANWFLQSIATYNYIIVDTNMLMKHYCSNLLFRLIRNTDFNLLHFKLPRLAILEIERIANQEKDKTKRLALFATTEIMFLKAHKAELLPPLDVSLLTSFLEKAGRREVDAWIRKEVHDFATQFPSYNCLFMTCDLTNSLASWAEGLNTCYLSELEQNEFLIPTSLETAEQLAEFILNSVITFEKIRMDVYIDGINCAESYQIEGIWSGKTPYHWNHDCIRVERYSASQ